MTALTRLALLLALCGWSGCASSPKGTTSSRIYLDAGSRALMTVTGGSRGSVEVRNLGPGPLRLLVLDRGRRQMAVSLEPQARYEGDLTNLRQVTITNGSAEGTTFTWDTSRAGTVTLHAPSDRIQ